MHVYLVFCGEIYTIAYFFSFLLCCSLCLLYGEYVCTYQRVYLISDTASFCHRVIRVSNWFPEQTDFTSCGAFRESLAGGVFTRATLFVKLVLATATCLAGCLFGCPSPPVLYQNGNRISSPSDSPLIYVSDEVWLVKKFSRGHP